MTIKLHRLHMIEIFAMPANFYYYTSATIVLQVYYEGMSSRAEREGMSFMELPPAMVPADSGLGSTAPSEIVDPEASELTSSQEEALIYGPSHPPVGPYKKSELRNGSATFPHKTAPILAAMPQRSATVDSPAHNALQHGFKGEELTNNHILPSPRNLVSMVSASTATSGSGTSIAAVEGGNEE